MNKLDGRPVPNASTELIVFVSQIFVAILFFLCLFRFLLRCCGKATTTATQNDQIRNERRAEDVRRCSFPPSHLLLVRSGRLPSSDLLRYPSNNFPFILDPSMLEEQCPPKYEDALKLPTSTVNELRRISSANVENDVPPNVVLPPPLYDANVGGCHANERPPAYSLTTVSGNIRASSSLTNLTTQARPSSEEVTSPSAKSPARHSLGPVELTRVLVNLSTEEKIECNHEVSMEESTSEEVLPASSYGHVFEQLLEQQPSTSEHADGSGDPRLRRLSIVASLSTFIPKGSAKRVRNRPPTQEQETNGPLEVDLEAHRMEEKEEKLYDGNIGHV